MEQDPICSRAKLNGDGISQGMTNWDKLKDGEVRSTELTTGADQHINIGGRWIVEDILTSTKKKIDTIKDNCSIKENYGS